jgi:hypothetical protein
MPMPSSSATRRNPVGRANAARDCFVASLLVEPGVPSLHSVVPAQAGTHEHRAVFMDPGFPPG